MNLAMLYRKYGTKILIIPLIVLAAFTYIAIINPGISYGIDFRGGIRVSFSSAHPVPADSIAQRISNELGVSEVSVIPTEVPGAGTYGGIVDAVYPEPSAKKVSSTPELVPEGSRDPNEEFKEAVLQIIKSEVPDAENIVVRDVSPSLGAKFWEHAVSMLLWAVVLLKAVVLFAFRRNLPISKVLGILFLDVVIAAAVGMYMKAPLVALALVLVDTIILMVTSPDATPTIIMLWSSVFDAIGMLALMAVFDVPLTLQTMAIILMMVGYSIDTDIVLSTHLLKRSKKEEGDEYERAGRASSTGIHMSGTTLVAMIFILAVGYLTRNLSVIRIGMVMIFGILADIVITWLFNAPLMISWVRKHESST